jgi:hypothetical protein
MRLIVLDLLQATMVVASARFQLERTFDHIKFFNFFGYFSLSLLISAMPPRPSSPGALSTTMDVEDQDFVMVDDYFDDTPSHQELGDNIDDLQVPKKRKKKKKEEERKKIERRRKKENYRSGRKL